MILTQKCEDVLKDNYLPYAMSVIVARAITNIDGFKPVHRRVLYTMLNMKINGRAKSTNVVGQTMKLHPNGDDPIYDALIRMTGNVNDREKGHNALLFPFIDGKGNFGKAYSSSIEPAAARYTEVRLHPWTKELLFEGLDEDAVDMVDNFDGNMKEPLLLPVKFPNILVNTAPGVAVGMSSHIPSYNLREVCEATRAIIEGSAKNIEDLSKILIAPDFPMGGVIYNNGTSLLDALDKKGVVYTGSKVSINGNRLSITELPYQVKVESVISKITELAKMGEFPDLVDIQDLSDINGFHLALDFRTKNCVASNLDNVFRYGKLRNTVSYINRCIIDGEPKLLDVYELLEEWLKFRLTTVNRIYNFRLNAGLEKEVRLSAWEIVREHLKDVATTLTNMSEGQAKEALMGRFGLNEVQVNALINARIKDLTTDNADRKLQELHELRKDIQVNREMVESKDKKLEKIYDELGSISERYGVPRSTMIGDPIDLSKPKKNKVVFVDETQVSVVMTSDGYLKKFRSVEKEEAFKDYLDGASIISKVTCRNDEKLLIFTYSGKCHCIPVSEIDESNGDKKMHIRRYLTDDKEKVLYMTNSGDFKRTIYVVTASGKGVAIPLGRVAGGRSLYKSLYNPVTEGKVWVTEGTKFFYVAQNNKAAYVDLTKEPVSDYNTWTFRICSVGKQDEIRGILSTDYIADFEELIEPECEIYQKGYLVKIKHPIFRKREKPVVIEEEKEEESYEI